MRRSQSYFLLIIYPCDCLFSFQLYFVSPSSGKAKQQRRIIKEELNPLNSCFYSFQVYLRCVKEVRRRQLYLQFYHYSNTNIQTGSLPNLTYNQAQFQCYVLKVRSQIDSVKEIMLHALLLHFAATWIITIVSVIHFSL